MGPFRIGFPTAPAQAARGNPAGAVSRDLRASAASGRPPALSSHRAGSGPQERRAGGRRPDQARDPRETP